MGKMKKLLSIILAATIWTYSVVPVYAEVGTTAPSDGGILETILLDDCATQETASSDQEKTEEEENVLPQISTQSEAAVYSDGTILLYNYAQLAKVGSGEVLMTGDATEQGTGEPVKDADGRDVVYGLDSQYRMVQDIPLPEGEVWQLPEGFSGRIAPADTQTERVLYNAESDTVFVYHLYQLAVMSQDDAAQQPVLDGDAQAATFGVGQLIYPDGEEQPYLTYGPEHTYVLSARFSTDLPVSTYAANTTLAAGTDYEGRDFAGQVIKTINGVDYILIGNADQLRAIGSGDPVYTAVYQAKLKELHWEVDKEENGQPIMLYGGDADLLQSQNGVKNYSFGEKGIGKASGGLLETVDRCGVDQQTGEIDPSMDIEDSGHSYDANENYVIFRDIDLNELNSDTTQSNWTPLMFSGTMVGVKSENGEHLWNDTATAFTATGRPTISNVRVIQDTALDVGERMGVGLFSTLYSETGEVSGGTGVPSFGSTGTTVVSNLILDRPVIHTTTTETHCDASLLNSLLTGLGWLVGGHWILCWGLWESMSGCGKFSQIC